MRRRPLLAPLWMAASLGAGVASAAPPSIPSGLVLPPGFTLPQGTGPIDVNQILQQLKGQPAPQPSEPGSDSAAEPGKPLSVALGADPEKQFQDFARDVVKDGVMTPGRRERLQERARDLGLDPRASVAWAEEEAGRQGDRIGFLLGQAQVLGIEGELKPEDRRFLETRARDSGLPAAEAAELVDLAVERARKLDLYRSVVEAFLEDGVLDREEQRRLAERREALPVSEEEHREIAERSQERLRRPAADVLAQVREAGREFEAPLELFGRAFFAREARRGPGGTLLGPGEGPGFEPAQGLPPPDDYLVGPGDTFHVSLWGRLEKEHDLVVDPEGRVQFPQVGAVRVAGLSYAAARDLLRSRAESITGVSAAVTLTQMRALRVFVVGEVERPGSFTLTPLSTVVHALLAAEGPTPLGSLRGVVLRRSGSVAAAVDLYEFVRTGHAGGDRPLENGDVVVVPRAKTLVRLGGSVRRPAVYELRDGEGLRELLEYAGGLAADAYGGRVQVERAEENRRRVVLDVALPGLAQDFALQDGDAVRVFPLSPEVENEVTLYGHAYQTGASAHFAGMRVSDLVGPRENLKPEVDLEYAVVLRQTGADRRRAVLPFRLGAALDGSEPGENLPLEPRDQVYVFARDQFRPALQARASGQVRTPGTYRIEEGARTADLLRLAGGPTPEALLGRAEVLRYLPDRTRLTLYVDLQKALTGETAENLLLQDEDELVVHAVWDRTFPESVEVAGEVKRPGEVPLTQAMTIRDLVFKAGGLTKDAHLGVAHLYRTERLSKEVTIHTFHLGKALEGEPQEDLALQDQDQVVIHSAFQFAPPRKVLAQGMVNRPGEYPYAINMRVRDLVLAAGGVREEAYLDQAEIVRSEVRDGEMVETRTLRFSLQEALAGDPEQNLPVSPYDKLFVKTIPEWRETRKVELKGEILFPGTYFVSKGERLSSVLRRAGGYTPEAYLRGAVFSRESARRLQEERFAELRERLQQTVLRVAATEITTAVAIEDVTAQKQFVASQEALLNRLASSKATGRVVVTLLPLDELAGSTWDIELEDGDALTVPPRPQTVSVVGQVYNPTSILWEPSHPTVEHYLAKTGGPTKDASEGEIYVVLADGTVLSPQSLRSQGWWSKDIARTELQPGDAVLVPEKVLRFALLRGIRDISQTVFQLAVTAGVLVTLF